MTANDVGKIVMYPFVKYNGWTFPAYPTFKDDVEAQLQRVKDFDSQEGDIMFSTAPKSGSHWIGEILCMLVDQTTEYSSRHVNANFHLDFFQNYDHIKEELYQRRILHTHLPFRFLPTKHKFMKNKIVYTNRNPKDRHVSQYLFLRGLHGYPSNWKWEEYFDEVVRPDNFYTGWFNYTREMTAALKDKSDDMHQVLYEDLLIDPCGEIERLAKFLEVPYSREFIESIAEKCEFNNFKEHIFDASTSLHKEGKSTMCRKGVIGDWKDWFTVAQNEEFDAMYNREMDGMDLQFTYEMPKRSLTHQLEGPEVNNV